MVEEETLDEEGTIPGVHLPPSTSLSELSDVAEFPFAPPSPRSSTVSSGGWMKVDDGSSPPLNDGYDSSTPSILSSLGSPVRTSPYVTFEEISDLEPEEVQDDISVQGTSHLESHSPERERQSEPLEGAEHNLRGTSLSEAGEYQVDSHNSALEGFAIHPFGWVLVVSLAAFSIFIALLDPKVWRQSTRFDGSPFLNRTFEKASNSVVRLSNLSEGQSSAPRCKRLAKGLAIGIDLGTTYTLAAYHPETAQRQRYNSKVGAQALLREVQVVSGPHGRCFT